MLNLLKPSLFLGVVLMFTVMTAVRGLAVRIRNAGIVDWPGRATSRC